MSSFKNTARNTYFKNSFSRNTLSNHPEAQKFRAKNNLNYSFKICTGIISGILFKIIN